MSAPNLHVVHSRRFFLHLRGRPQMSQSWLLGILGACKTLTSLDEFVAFYVKNTTLRQSPKQGYFWAIACDDRPWSGSQPPAVVYSYAPGRGHTHANALLGGYRGILQCDGYAAYKKLGGAKSADPSVTLAFCWSHVRRGFYDLAKTKAPIATEALKRIAALYEIEARIRGNSAAERLAARQAESKPLVAELRVWFEAQIAKLPARGPAAEAIRYGLNHWAGLERFLGDGRIELDTNSVERAMIPARRPADSLVSTRFVVVMIPYAVWVEGNDDRCGVADQR
jgi:Transposase IS66 family